MNKNTTDKDDPIVAYAAGAITHFELEDKTGLWFGDVLIELGKRGLQLPRFDTTAHYNEKQKALYNSIFGG